MVVSIEARNFDLTDAIRTRVEKAINLRLKVYSERITKATVVLDYMKKRKGGQPAADVHMVLEVPGPDIVVTNKFDDLYEAVDGVLDKACDQLQERKEK